MRSYACVLAVVVLSSGCAIGPVSSYMVGKHEKAALSRSIAMSQTIPAEKKAPLFQAVNLGASENEIAVGFGVNILELVKFDRTGAEYAAEAGAMLADGAIYAGVGYGLKEAYDSMKGDNNTSTKATILINGNGNNVISGEGSNGRVDQSEIAE